MIHIHITSSSSPSSLSPSSSSSSSLLLLLLLSLLLPFLLLILSILLFYFILSSSSSSSFSSSSSSSSSSISSPKVLCGRYINHHMLAHHDDTGHPMALSLADISVWCFPCDSYLEHASLRAAKNAVCVSKFGCDLGGES